MGVPPGSFSKPLQDLSVLNLHFPTRPLLTALAATATLGLAAGPADAARKTKPKPRADLTIKQLHVDLSDEGTLLVSGNILNVGRKSARPSDVVIALSDDDIFDEDDDVLDEVDFLRLAAGVKRGFSDEVDIPLDVDTAEGLNVLVCADAYDNVFERNEDNNCVAQEVVVDDLLPADDGSGDEPTPEAEPVPADEEA